MKFESVWQGETKKYQGLEKDIDCDIAVIGGGIAGYLTAFKLAEAGRKVTLLEANRLFSGTTGRTTAKISVNQGSVYAELSARYGQSAAKLYYCAQEEGKREYAELVERHHIECDWMETDSYVFSEDGGSNLENVFEVLRGIGAECEMAYELPPFRGACALKMKGEYLFDPLKFLSALPVSFEIYESTRAVKVDTKRKLIQTDKATVRADKIIIATHYPIVNSRGGYFMKLRQSMSYTVAVREKCTENMYLNEREDGLSVRPYAEGTLFGGGDHRTGRIESERHFDRLKERAKSLFGADAVTHCWCAEDVMTFDGMPMAGRYSKNTADVYVVTGFNKWGMTNAMVCASVLTDAILKRKNAYAEIFSPQRHIKKSFGDFTSNAMTNAKGIILGYFGVSFKTAADVPAGSGMIVFYNGKRRAVYRDLEGNLHAIGCMCPHMHCELAWNGNTNTWDCPCHGSRFDIYGNILSEPAVKACKYEGKNTGE